MVPNDFSWISTKDDGFENRPFHLSESLENRSLVF